MVAHGERNGNNKLTPEEVAAIRRALALKEAKQRELARRYGVTQGYISKLGKNKTWRNGDAE